MIALQSLIIKKNLFIVLCICTLICTACSSKSIGTEPFPSGKDEANPDNLFADITDEELLYAIEKNVILTSDTEIESHEWIDEEKSCLRIKVQYKEEPDDNYRHKEDYFFFLDVNHDIQMLYVDYPDVDWKNIDEDRFLWSACDFNAHFEDVTFDGHDDLIIFLGHAGSHGTLVSCAYIWENGSFRYEPTFEDIPYYEADVENQVINGWNKNSASSETHFIYEYRNGEFVLINEENYEFQNVP